MKTLTIVLFASLLATTAFADNVQSNGSSQSVVNSNVQNGANNVSSISSVQRQIQTNTGVSQGSGVNAQQNIAIQEALNINQQAGNFNVSVIANEQISIQKNAAITLPALPTLAK
jgi:hypothetical protein